SAASAKRGWSSFGSKPAQSETPVGAAAKRRPPGRGRSGTKMRSFLGACEVMSGRCADFLSGMKALLYKRCLFSPVAQLLLITRDARALRGGAFHPRDIRGARIRGRPMSVVAPVPNPIKTAMPFVGLCSPSIQCVDMIAKRCDRRIWLGRQEFERFALRMMKCGYID